VVACSARESVLVGTLMATILEFRPATRPATLPQMKPKRGGASAEIVFFPGVRYERAIAKVEAKPKRRSKKRDKLVLKD
jgi:hypothetical protein